MKYIVDTESLIECLDYLGTMKINGEIYVPLSLIKAFVQKFPKDPVEEEKK